MINKKQIMVIALALVIITAGVLQYTYGKTGFSSQKNNEERLGEAVYVDNINGDPVNLLDDGTDQSINEKTGIGDDYFIQAKLDRETIRSRHKEELQDLATGKSTAGESIPKAQDEYLDLIKRSEIEATIESLIKQRGFQDVVVLFGTNGSVDLVVKADSLSQDQTAQISDIVIRHAGVEMEDIHIKNMN